MSAETESKFVEVDADFLEPHFRKPLDVTKEAEARFKSFDVYSTTYATVGPDDHAIQVGILVPHGWCGKICPLHVKFHGGGFCTGDALFPNWHHDHHVRLAVETSAITILPNYRLLPEHNGYDIMSDIDKFWQWFRDSFPAVIEEKKPGIKFNKDQLLLSGDSAGGFLVAYSWLTQKDLAIKALYFQFPMLFHYEKEAGTFMGSTEEYVITKERAKAHLDEVLPTVRYLQDAGKLRTISSARPPKHMSMAYALSVTGEWTKAFKALDIKGQLEEKKNAPATFPPMFIYHGTNDSAVPIKNTEKFVEMVKEKYGKQYRDENIYFEKVAGENHAFDYEWDENVAGNEWLKRILDGIKRAWIG